MIKLFSKEYFKKLRYDSFYLTQIEGNFAFCLLVESEGHT